MYDFTREEDKVGPWSGYGHLHQALPRRKTELDREKELKDLRRSVISAFRRADHPSPVRMAMDTLGETGCIFFEILPDLEQKLYDVDAFACTFKAMREENPDCTVEDIRRATAELGKEKPGWSS